MSNVKDFVIDVYCVCWNEEILLPHFIRHYQENFGAKITFFDNHSDDRSKEIILDSGCIYKTYDTKGTLSDVNYLYIKNDHYRKSWKESNAAFVIVCDADEFLEIDFDVDPRYTIINAYGYDVIGGLDSRDGVPNKLMNKHLMFSPRQIQEINYRPGCHSCSPVGNISGSREIAKIMHRKYISPEYILAKHSAYEKRLSELNKKHNWGAEYLGVEIDKINAKFKQLRKDAVDIDRYHLNLITQNNGNTHIKKVP